MIYDGWFPEDADGIKYPACKVGYAERVRCGPQELKEYNCGRSYESCARAFVCAACGYRRPRRASGNGLCRLGGMPSVSIFRHRDTRLNAIMKARHHRELAGRGPRSQTPMVGCASVRHCQN